VPRRRGKGHGRLGQGEREVLRTRGQARPLDRGRLRQVRRARDPARPALRRRHHGSAVLRPRAVGRNLEARGEPVSVRAARLPGALRRAAVLPD